MQTTAKTDTHLKPICSLASSGIIPMLRDVLETPEIVTIQIESDGFSVFQTRCNEDCCIDVMVAVEGGGHCK
jgi:hypothetical protein